jgi:hypothetical protein
MQQSRCTKDLQTPMVIGQVINNRVHYDAIKVMKTSSMFGAKAAVSLVLFILFSSAIAGEAGAQEWCDHGYVWREAFPNDYACVVPQVRDQARLDNEAAPTRWAPGPYGPDTCVPGFVWREVTPTDHVCVLPSTRDRVIYENQVAPERTSNSGNPRWCVSGYVWREAVPGDVVCVPPASRAEAWDDNARAAQRRGSRICVSGYVWREAGPSDFVCVTTQVREQARLDNIEYNLRTRVRGARCNRYGHEAVAQFRQARALGCSISGPRWSDNLTGHVNWCNTEASADFANSEASARRSELAACAAGSGASESSGTAAACSVSVQLANSSCVNLDGTASSIPPGLIATHGCGPDEGTARQIAYAYFSTQSCISSDAGCCQVTEQVFSSCLCR